MKLCWTFLSLPLTLTLRYPLHHFLRHLLLSLVTFHLEVGDMSPQTQHLHLLTPNLPRILLPPKMLELSIWTRTGLPFGAGLIIPEVGAFHPEVGDRLLINLLVGKIKEIKLLIGSKKTLPPPSPLFLLLLPILRLPIGIVYLWINRSIKWTMENVICVV